MARLDARALRQTAQLAMHKGKYKQALQAYRALEQAEPSEGEWSLRVAQMSRRLGSTQDAVDALVRACDNYARTGFYAKAMAACKQIQQIEPWHSGARIRLEEIALRAEESTERRRRFRESTVLPAFAAERDIPAQASPVYEMRGSSATAREVPGCQVQVAGPVGIAPPDARPESSGCPAGNGAGTTKAERVAAALAALVG